MDLSATYLGFDLRSPLVASASPLSDNVERIRRLEEAGIAAVVLPSLFEEDIGAGTRPTRYVDLVREAKGAVGIPVIASLNGATPGGWTRYARLTEEAGADAVKLNLHYFPSDLERDADEHERAYAEIVEAVCSNVRIPVTVKLGPFFTNLGHFARRLQGAGARALVLFNRVEADRGRRQRHDAERVLLRVSDSTCRSTSIAGQ